jgi:hypothetical protein
MYINAGKGVLKRREKQAVGLSSHLPVGQAQQVFRKLPPLDDSFNRHPSDGPRSSSTIPSERVEDAALRYDVSKDSHSMIDASLTSGAHAHHHGAVIALSAEDSKHIDRSMVSHQQGHHHQQHSTPAALSSKGDHSSVNRSKSRAEETKDLPPGVAKALDSIDAYLDEELRILATQCETPLQGSYQRLAVFQTANRILTSAVHPRVAALMERITKEYDDYLRALEERTSESTLIRERKKIEEHYRVHYTEVANAKEEDLQKRKKEFQSAETQLIANYKKIENLLATVKEDNEKLRKAQLEDHERMLSMAQSVTESRLAMQRAELAHKEMEIEMRKIRSAEKQNFDLLQDHTEMYRLIKQHHIAYEPRCKFAIDALLATVR